jgi:succinate-acetate transporter protein
MLQLSALVFPILNVALAILYQCEVAQPVPQPRCPGALPWISLLAWGIFTVQLFAASILAWISVRRTLSILLQLLFGLFGFWSAVGAILSVSGQWL